MNQAKEVEVNVANMSLWIPFILDNDVDWFIKFAKESGYNGLEWHPLKGRRLQAADAEVVRSFHQSWRSARYLREAFPNLTSMASVYGLPMLIPSLIEINKQQTFLLDKKPVVLYPEPQTNNVVRSLHYSEKIFQPTPEVLFDKFKVGSIWEMNDKYKELGYTGYCPDTLHTFVDDPRYPADFSDWERTLPFFMDQASEVHIQTREAEGIRYLIEGKGDHPIKGMMALMKECGMRGRRAVVEVAAHQLMSFYPKSIFGLQEVHKRISATVNRDLGH